VSATTICCVLSSTETRRTLRQMLKTGRRHIAEDMRDRGPNLEDGAMTGAKEIAQNYAAKIAG
jgi:hypothetical protein